MPQQFKQMSCYLLAGGKSNNSEDFSKQGELTRLENTYRRYAAIFDNVKLVIKADQAHEHYLNYPHVIDNSDRRHFSVGLQTALNDATSDAIFVGSSEVFEFPLELPVHLVKNYNGESYLGFSEQDDSDDKQLMFGIYNRAMLPDLLQAAELPTEKSSELIRSSSRLIPRPDRVSGQSVSVEESLVP